MCGRAGRCLYLGQAKAEMVWGFLNMPNHASPILLSLTDLRTGEDRTNYKQSTYNMRVSVVSASLLRGRTIVILWPMSLN